MLQSDLLFYGSVRRGCISMYFKVSFFSAKLADLLGTPLKLSSQEATAHPLASSPTLRTWVLCHLVSLNAGFQTLDKPTNLLVESSLWDCLHCGFPDGAKIVQGSCSGPGGAVQPGAEGVGVTHLSCTPGNFKLYYVSIYGINL